jgi:hypothetical protein
MFYADFIVRICRAHRTAPDIRSATTLLEFAAT